MPVCEYTNSIWISRKNPNPIQCSIFWLEELHVLSIYFSHQIRSFFCRSVTNILCRIVSFRDKRVNVFERTDRIVTKLPWDRHIFSRALLVSFLSIYSGIDDLTMFYVCTLCENTFNNFRGNTLLAYFPNRIFTYTDIQIRKDKPNLPFSLSACKFFNVSRRLRETHSVLSIVNTLYLPICVYCIN